MFRHNDGKRELVKVMRHHRWGWLIARFPGGYEHLVLDTWLEPRRKDGVRGEHRC